MTNALPASSSVRPEPESRSFVARLVEQALGHRDSAQASSLSRHVAHAHFCRFNSLEIDPLRLVEEIAGSLASRHPTFLDAIMADERDTVISIHGEANVGVADHATVTGVQVTLNVSTERSVMRAFEQLVARPLNELRRTIGDDQVVVIVDALDETLGSDLPYPNSMVGFLSAILHPNYELPRGLRFIITSRPDPRAIKGLQIRALQIHLIEDEPDENNDVRSYLTDYYSDLDSGTLLADLAASSRGNFLYAFYLAEDIRRRYPGGNPGFDYRFPQALDELYAEYLDREVARERSTWTKLVRPVLGLLSTARGGGLPLPLLKDATDLRRSEVDDALDLLAQFVARNHETGAVRLYHDSFGEFLARAAPPYVYTQEAQSDLSTALLEAFRTGEPAASHAYALSHLPAHLQAGGMADALRSLLVEHAWLEARLAQAGTAGVLQDLALALPWTPAAELARLLRMSAHILDEQPEQFRSQLVGRLATSRNETLRYLADQLAAQDDVVWLRPVTTSMSTIAGPEVITFAPGAGPVLALAFSRPRDILLSCSTDSYIRAWSIDDGGQTFTLEAPSGAVSALACSADRPIAASADDRGHLHIWDLEARVLVRAFDGQPGEVASLLFSEDSSKLYSFTAEGVCQRWEIGTGECLARIALGFDITAVGSFARPARIFVNSQEGVAFELATTSLEVVRTFEDSGDPGFWSKCAAVSPDGSVLITSGHDRIRRFDLATGNSLKPEYLGHVFFDQLEFSPSGSRIVGRSQRLVVLTSTLEYQGVVGGALSCMTFCGSDSLVATGSQDGYIKVWNLEADLSEEDFRHRHGISFLSSTLDGTVATVASYSNIVEFFDLTTQNQLGSAVVDPELWYNRTPVAVGVALAPDGKYCLIAGSMGALCVVEVQALAAADRCTIWGNDRVLQGEPRQVGNPITGRVAAIGFYGRVVLWDMETNRKLGTVALDSRESSHTIIGPIGDTVFAVTHGRMLELSVASRRIVSTVAHEGITHATTGWLMSGPTVLGVTAEGIVTCLRAGGEIVGMTISGLPTVDALATCPNDGRVLVGTADGTVRCIDFSSTDMLWEVRLGIVPIRRLVVSPDERWAIACGDTELLLLDVFDGKVLATFRSESTLSCVLAVRAANLVIAGETSGRVHLLEVVGST